MPPKRPPGAVPRVRPAIYVRADAALARLARCDCAARKSSSPSPRSPGSDPQVPPTSPRLDHRPEETYGVNHPHMASPSIHSPQSLAKNSLHYLRKCSSIDVSLYQEEVPPEVRLGSFFLSASSKTGTMLWSALLESFLCHVPDLLQEIRRMDWFRKQFEIMPI
jgi:hypothetical protein